MENGASSYLRFLNGDKNGFVDIVRDHKDGLTLFTGGMGSQSSRNRQPVRSYHSHYLRYNDVC